MKRKQERRGSKGVNPRKPEKETGLEETVKELTKTQQLPGELLKMLSELGLRNQKDDCSGNCIACKKKVSCETYKKIRDCFTG